MIVTVKIANYIWDNYQGGCGVISIETHSFDLSDYLTLPEIKPVLIDHLNEILKVDSFGIAKFSGHGIIEIKLG
jgi:hypothetical protein